MLNKEVDAQAFKDTAYAALAAVAKGLASPRRLALLDLLAQRPFPVEALATQVGQPVANVSQHLQVLRRAGLVDTTRHGTTIEYRLAPGVAEVLGALRSLAQVRSAELARAQQAWREQTAVEGIDRATLARRLADGTAVLLDVRAPDEFDHGHHPGARSLPLAELSERLDDLPDDVLIVATCRGPFCTFSAQAVARLQASGRQAMAFEDGPPEWRLHGEVAS